MKRRTIYLFFCLSIASMGLYGFMNECGSDKVIQDPEIPEELHIYLCLGQSNMEGHARVQPEDTVNINPRFKVLRGVDCVEQNLFRNRWYTAIPPLVHCHSGVSIADFFGRTLVEKLPEHVNVGLINVSIGGCRIELFDKEQVLDYTSNAPDWMKGNLNNFDNNPYQRLVELANQAIEEGGVIKGILLHQGESNVGDREWTVKVQKIYNTLLADIGYEPNSVPLLAGELVSFDQNGSCASMNEIINTLPAFIPNSHIISSVGCESAGDGLHFNTTGYRELGKRYANKMMTLLK